MLVVLSMETKRLTIFVVEDTFIFQQLISKLLEHMSAEILFFTTGENAVKQLAVSKPDMAILDYNLDGDMTGLDTLKVLRLHQPDVYAILFSTRPGLNTSENFQLYGAFDQVEKNKEGLQLLKKKISRANCFLQVPWI